MPMRNQSTCRNQPAQPQHMDINVSGSQSVHAVVLGCHMQQGGVTELAMALPSITVSSKDCQVACGILGCHCGPGNVRCSGHPAGSVGERLVRVAFLLLGVLMGW